MYKYKLAGFSQGKAGIESEVKEIADPVDAKAFLGKYSVTWLDCAGLSEKETSDLGDIFGFHKLCIDDCSHFPQRPKIDDYKEYFFLVAKEIEYKKEVKSHQVGVFVGRNYMVTVREKPGDLFQALFDKIADKSPRLEDKGSDYLCYAVVDKVVDGYIPILEVIEDEIEAVEKDILGDVSKETLKKIFKLKKDLLLLRKIIIPTREMLLFFEREDLPNMSDKTRVYLRDVYDHIVTATELVDTYREMTSSTIESYLSTLSNNINQIVKVLTVLASLVLVPTLIAGIYGMNFEMPEYKWKYGYPFALALMLVTVLIQLILFKRKKWI